MKGCIPKLRTDLEFIPTLYQGQRALLVRDYLGLIQKPVILQGESFNLFALIDGKRSVQDIQLELIRQRGGILVSSSSVEKLLAELDAAYLLESDRYHQGKSRALADYSRLAVRTASHAGLSYPLSSAKLKIYLDSILNAAAEKASRFDQRKILALVSPHIDLEAGKRVYAEAYQAIRSSSPKIIFLIGTGHSLEDAFLSLTEKDFETPFGLVKTDKNLVRKLKKAAAKTVSLYDIAHQQEHSLEFQLIFCQHLFGSDFRLVPVLCGSFRRELYRVQRPSEISGVAEFLAELKEIIEDFSQDVLIVAGVDFSHIGPKFGHSQRAASLLLETKKHDQILIDACWKHDVKALWTEVRKAKDYYNVCGFSALACLLEVLTEVQGHFLDYGVWKEEPTQSAVSFAAIAFEAK